jgi:hypothetical protein
MPTQLYFSFIYYLERLALPRTRYLCYLGYDDTGWEFTDVNDVVEEVGFEGERAQEVVHALQAIAPYPSRTRIDQDQIVKALKSCEVFPEYLQEEHEAAAAQSRRN